MCSTIFCRDPGSIRTGKCSRAHLGRRAASWTADGASRSGDVSLSPVRFAASPHNGIKSLKMAKLGLMQPGGAGKRRLERQERGRKEVPRMGKVLGRTEEAAPAALRGRVISSCHKLPNPTLFFGWMSRDAFGMSPRCSPRRVSYGGSVPAAPGEGRDRHGQQTLGCRTCPNHSLLFPTPPAIQIIYLDIYFYLTRSWKYSSEVIF